jgi:Protein of unknown function (DUF3237)
VQLEPLIRFRATMVPHPIGGTPRGQRLDIELAGEVLPGSRISGHVAGIDYLTVRPDGVAELEVRATVTTEDEQVVSVRATGLAMIGDDGLASGTPRAALRDRLGAARVAQPGGRHRRDARRHGERHPRPRRLHHQSHVTPLAAAIAHSAGRARPEARPA